MKLQQAVALQQAGQLANALATYQEILEADPNHFDSLHMSGVIAIQTGKLEHGIVLIEKAIRVNPSSAVAYHNRGYGFWVFKRYDEALASYDKALILKPDYADAHNNRGNVLHDLKRYDEALASYGKALALKPDYADAYNNQGNVLRDLKRYDGALASYDKTLLLKPDHACACINRGNALGDLKRFDEALVSYDKALLLRPDSAEAHNNRGKVLRDLKRFNEALADCDKALAIKPDYAEAHYNRGNTLSDLKRYDEALASYDNALKIRPEYAEAHLNESACRLLVGDFEGGWKKYEWRWKHDDLLPIKRNFSQPLWLGKEDVAGKSVLLHAEQGLGDTIQFARYVRLVAEKGARVLLEVPPTLRALLSDLDGAHRIFSRGEPLPEFDFHCPLLSLPLALNTCLENTPASIPYLRPAGDLVYQWDAKLGKQGTPRIGIVWSGSPNHKNDSNRSIDLSRMLGLENPDIALVSLQNEVRSEDGGVLAANRQILHFGSELENFSDTAALVSLMDLVISVDTSVAHLAGALGKPVWILLPYVPDWRWMLDREDSYWYPTARLFRQT